MKSVSNSLTALAVTAALCGLPLSASAHSFGRVYNLPVPVWLYLYGAAAALLVSFVIIGYFISRPGAGQDQKGIDLRGTLFGRLVTHRWLKRSLQLLSVTMLLLTIVGGFVGTNNSYKNINMTLFWIAFGLGFTYLTALLGNLYAVMNPWRILVDALARLPRLDFDGRWRWPTWLSYYPALLLYFGFIWVELFAKARPFSLSWILLGYTLLNLAGAWSFGRRHWFRYGEFFGLFLSLTAKLAPLQYTPDAAGGRGQLVLRAPGAGLLEGRAASASVLLFILFMLSSTAYDGFRETTAWVALFWRDIYQLLTPLIGDNYVETFPIFKALYTSFLSVGLLASPFFYLGIYLLFLWMAKRLTGTERPLRVLALDFAYSLVPIAFVYHVTHYFTLLVTQGMELVKLASDPFGLRWNLFGTANWEPPFKTLDPGMVWHTQVGLIVLGHVVSVYLAHVVALRLFPSHRSAVISQLPMLMLMVCYTALGLWILSLPISAGSVTGPAG